MLESCGWLLFFLLAQVAAGAGLVAVLLFTLVEAIQVRAQVIGITLPYQFLVMAPYLVTIVALALFVRRTRPPAALGR